MTCTFASISADRLGAGTVFEVKCLFAIDAIAVVYRADSAHFESGPTRKPIRNSDQQSAESDQLAPLRLAGLRLKVKMTISQIVRAAS
jgi:hypothetical protein